MIRKNPYGLSPTLSMTIDSAPFDYQALNRVELHLTENQHDMLVLEVTGMPARAITDYRNRAVELSMDLGGSFYETFHGYVVDVKPTSVTAEGLVNNSPFQSVEIVCLGASYDMKGKNTRAWERPYVQYVGQEMAEKYDYSYRAPSISAPLQAFLVQEDESDWQFLTRIAKQSGFSVVAHGTSIRIFDPTKCVQNNVSYHKLLSSRNLKGAPHPGQITSLSGSFADRARDGQYTDTIVPVIQSDGRTFDVSSSEVFRSTTAARFTERITSPATTYNEAVGTLKSRNVDFWDYLLDVSVTGLPGCQPGGVVSLDNYDGDFDGLWYVQGVCHHLTSGVFYTDLKLARNSSYEIANNGQRPRWFPPVPVLRNQRWQSRKKDISVY